MIGASGGHARAQLGHPAEDVWIAAQLVERDDLGMMGPEPGKEVADGIAVLADRIGRQRDAEGIDCSVEDRGQWMRRGRPERAGHDGVTRRGRTNWAAARAYC